MKVKYVEETIVDPMIADLSHLCPSTVIYYQNNNRNLLKS